MSKKLLEESTIRSFMKLANLQPLSDKFIKESWSESKVQEEGEQVEEELEEEGQQVDEELEEEGDSLEEEVVEEEGDSLEEAHVIYGQDEDAKSRGVPQDRQNPTSGGGAHKKAPKKTKVAKPGKMVAAKHAPADAKLKPMKQTHIHSAKPDSIEHSKKSNAPKKNNSEFEIVSESLKEMAMEDEVASPEAPEMGGGEEMGSAGESGDHQSKMKGLIRDMLNNLKQMGEEYGMTMEISDEGEGEMSSAPESPESPEMSSAPESPEEDDEEESMMQEKLDEMVEKLTKRVAARLVKESKKKR